MQWLLTVADLVSQLEQQERRQIQGTAAELLDAERARITMCRRLRAQTDTPVRLALSGGTVITGTVVEAVPAWWLVHRTAGAPGAAQILINPSAVVSIDGLAPGLGPEVSAVQERLGLGHALRRVAQQRQPVAVTLVDGAWREGRLAVVGQDHLDLRPLEQGTTMTIPFPALAAVAPRPPG